MSEQPAAVQPWTPGGPGSRFVQARLDTNWVPMVCQQCGAAVVQEHRALDLHAAWHDQHDEATR